jgi:hypothetical protein
MDTDESLKDKDWSSPYAYEVTLNALLDAEADQLCGARKYERAEGRNECAVQKNIHFVTRACS